MTKTRGKNLNWVSRITAAAFINFGCLLIGWIMDSFGTFVARIITCLVFSSGFGQSFGHENGSSLSHINDLWSHDYQTPTYHELILEVRLFDNDFDSTWNCVFALYESVWNFLSSKKEETCHFHGHLLREKNCHEYRNKHERTCSYRICVSYGHSRKTDFTFLCRLVRRFLKWFWTRKDQYHWWQLVVLDS